MRKAVALGSIGSEPKLANWNRADEERILLDDRAKLQRLTIADYRLGECATACSQAVPNESAGRLDASALIESIGLVAECVKHFVAHVGPESLDGFRYPLNQRAASKQWHH